MADKDSLQAENDKLRAELEGYKQRELADAKSALAAMTMERDHYRSEAIRNVDVGRQIASELQDEINRLKSQIDVKEQVARQLRVPSANASRN